MPLPKGENRLISQHIAKLAPGHFLKFHFDKLRPKILAKLMQICIMQRKCENARQIDDLVQIFKFATFMSKVEKSVRNWLTIRRSALWGSSLAKFRFCHTFSDHFYKVFGSDCDKSNPISILLGSGHPGCVSRPSHSCFRPTQTLLIG